MPELEAATGSKIQRNTEGLLDLCFEAENLPRWESLQKIRREQEYSPWKSGLLKRLLMPVPT